ncbi:siphovirus Gp157 family protein [Pseudorhodoplanes sp.]|uniref:siphovirus Gp157 family protein n=1 Tax=Pseudorhodoplanes sp. TaxID=1934341 RepID=UPI00391B2D15
MSTARRDAALQTHTVAIRSNIMSQMHIYQFLREQLLSEDPTIDERTLADTLEGLTDLHDIIAAVVRSALCDEAMADGLKGRITEMNERLCRLYDRADKRRILAREAMVKAGVQRVTAVDLTISLREGNPSVVILDEQRIPAPYWRPSAPKLDKQQLLKDLKTGIAVEGVQLSKPEVVLSVRTK